MKILLDGVNLVMGFYYFCDGYSVEVAVIFEGGYECGGVVDVEVVDIFEGCVVVVI